MVMARNWLLLMLLGIVLMTGFLLCPVLSSKQRLLRLRQNMRQDAARCLALSNAVASAQANVDWNRLQWYYAFREVEVADEEAWRMAVRKVASEATSLSNAFHRATDDLAIRRAKLMMLEQAAADR